MSHSVLLLLGLLMVLAFLRWRRNTGPRWARTSGARAGLGGDHPTGRRAVLRAADGPGDAVGPPPRPWGDWFGMAGTIVAGGAPFSIFQVIFNLGVTGKPFESPYRYYLDRDAPQLSFGFHEIRQREKLPVP